MEKRSQAERRPPGPLGDGSLAAHQGLPLHLVAPLLALSSLLIEAQALVVVPGLANQDETLLQLIQPPLGLLIRLVGPGPLGLHPTLLGSGNGALEGYATPRPLGVGEGGSGTEGAAAQQAQHQGQAG